MGGDIDGGVVTLGRQANAWYIVGVLWMKRVNGGRKRAA